MNELKSIIKKNLTNTECRINQYPGVIMLSRTCFWVKENFSAIIAYYGVKYYCYWDRSLNDVVVEHN